MMKKKITAKIKKVIKPSQNEEVPLEINQTKEINVEQLKEEVPQSEKATVSQVNPETFDFPMNTRFTMFGEVFVVKRAFREDNTDFREIVAKDTEILELRTLRKDAMAAKDFMIV